MKKLGKITKMEMIILAATALFLLLVSIRYITFPRTDYDGFTVIPSREVAETESFERIDINTADTATLRQLPGIGAALAARIVAYRMENGRFKSVEDLLQVNGIGERTLDALRPYITVENAS